LPIRAYVLWTCAILLGFAVGHRYISGAGKSNSGVEYYPPTTYGYNTSQDMERMTLLSNTPHISHLSTSDYDLLTEYANSAKSASVEVCAVLENIDSEQTAELCLPIVKMEIKADQNERFVNFVLGNWQKKGFTRAASEFSQLEKK